MPERHDIYNSSMSTKILISPFQGLWVWMSYTRWAMPIA